jgi:hypothetical protein
VKKVPDLSLPVLTVTAQSEQEKSDPEINNGIRLRQSHFISYSE